MTLKTNYKRNTDNLATFVITFTFCSLLIHLSKYLVTVMICIIFISTFATILSQIIIIIKLLFSHKILMTGKFFFYFLEIQFISIFFCYFRCLRNSRKLFSKTTSRVDLMKSALNTSLWYDLTCVIACLKTIPMYNTTSDIWN